MSLKKTTTIGFIGMTHLGLVTAIGAAEKGYEVICVDPDHLLINSLKIKKTQISEPQLNELWNKNDKRITFTSEAQLIKNCDLVYIAPDISTDNKGNSDLSAIDKLMNIALDSIKQNAVIVILSQVPPGYTRSKYKDAINLFYQVETLIFGRAIDRTLYPERFIVGCFNTESSLPEVYEEYLRSYACPVLVMRYESAELAKIAINMFLVSTVITTNTLAELCESIGADWGEIVPALRLDKRIGEYGYLNPGLGLSGGNLERDLATVVKLSNRYVTDSSVVDAWLHNSSHRKNWIWSIFKKFEYDKNPDLHIGILGLTYKENTNSTKNSPALVFLSHLDHKQVKVYDPIAPINTTSTPVMRVKTPLDAIQGCDILILATPWPEFREISVDFLIKNMPGRVLIDPYGIFLSQKDKLTDFNHFILGV